MGFSKNPKSGTDVFGNVGVSVKGNPVDAVDGSSVVFLEAKVGFDVFGALDCEDTSDDDIAGNSVMLMKFGL